MGNSTDSIRAQRQEARYQRQLERQKAKIARQEAREAQKAGEAPLSPEAVKTAEQLIAELSGDLQSGTIKGVKQDVKADLKAMKAEGTITQEEFEEAKKYLNSGKFKDELKEDLSAIGKEAVVDILTGDEFVIKRNTIQQREKAVKAELKQQIADGEITQAQYEAAKDYSGTGSYIGRFFGAKERDSRELFRVDRNRQHREETQAALESGEKHLSAKTQARLDASGMSLQDIYKIGDANGGAADATINYSYKRVQPGEEQLIETAFNENENGVHWTKRQAKKAAKEAGYTIEHAVEPEKVLESAGRGALIGAPGSYINVSQTQTSIVDGVATITNNQALKAVGVLPAVGAIVGAGTSTHNQATRVEDRAIPSNVPEGITTYDEYAKYLDENYSTDRGAALGKQIAHRYTYEDGTLWVEGFNAALARAAGTEDATGTPLNYEEAQGMLLEDVVLPERVQPKKTDATPPPALEVIEIEKTKTPDTEFVPVETECYKVKLGDNWFEVAKGKYGVSDAEAVKIARHLKEAYFKENEAELRAMGITSARGAFFVKVDDILCLPTELTVDGKTYNYKKSGTVNAGRLGGNVKNVSWTNPFKKEQDATTYGYRYVDPTKGTGQSGMTQDARNKAVDAIDAQDNDKVIYNVKEGEVVL